MKKEERRMQKGAQKTSNIQRRGGRALICQTAGIPNHNVQTVKSALLDFVAHRAVALS
jgi:hypothetical protein